MLTVRYAAPLVALSLALSACSGGGGTGSAPTSALPASSQQVATGTLKIGMPATSGTAAGARKPAYVSPATTYATLWIDSSTTGVRQACTPGGGNGTSGQCTINWTSTAGTHAFNLEVDNSSSPSGPGAVLADNSFEENLTTGLNSLPNVILNAVPAGIDFIGETDLGPNACPGLNPGQNCFSGTFSIVDASGQNIVGPGDYDDFGVCAAPTSTVGFLAGTCSGIEIETSIYFTAGCVPAAPPGTFTFSVAPVEYQPNNLGELSSAQLASYGLTYPNQNALAVDNFPTYTCAANGTISVAGPANGPITVESHAVKT